MREQIKNIISERCCKQCASWDVCRHEEEPVMHRVTGLICFGEDCFEEVEED